MVRMINLFNVPSHYIDTGSFTNLLHDKVVTQLEEEFADYIGIKYCVGLNSATSAIQCLFSSFFKYETGETNNVINVPNLIPPVVVNALIQSNNKVKFVDNPTWVGNSYILHEFKHFAIYDSAQEVGNRLIKDKFRYNDIIFYSFFPTKPVSSCDGCIVASNNKEKINLLRNYVNNGTNCSKSSWKNLLLFPGQKMYINSIQAKIALKNLRKLDKKKEKLDEIRDIYDKHLSYHTINARQSYHLYRILVKNQSEFIKNMEKAGIETGIHYRPLYQLLYKNECYKPYIIETPSSDLTNTQYEGNHCVSLPFHEALTKSDALKVVRNVKKFLK